jgi:F-type H+-transporting ATPase subunit epsilon
LADKKIHLRVITPTEIMFDEKVTMVIMRCTTGDLGVLQGHEARSAALDYGALRILSDDSDMRILAVYGGLVEIKSDVVTVLANDAEWPHDIDPSKALADHELFSQNLRKNDDTLGIQRDQVMLRRALVQIEVSSYPLISK